MSWSKKDLTLTITNIIIYIQLSLIDGDAYLIRQVSFDRGFPPSCWVNDSKRHLICHLSAFIKILRVCWPSEPRRSIGSGLSSSLWRFRRRWKKTGQQFPEFEDLKIGNLSLELWSSVWWLCALCVASSQCWHRLEKPTNSILLHLGSILSRPNRSLGIRRWDRGDCAIHKAF